MMREGFLNSEQTKKKYLDLINSVKRSSVKNIESSIKINLHFAGQPFLEITGSSDESFDVRFYDGEILVHQTTLKCNMWTKVNREYFTKWRTEVRNSSDEVIFNDVLSLKNRKVYIALDSESLGDTIAWVPYFEEFRKKHNCELVVSTFKNSFFKKEYPEIKFVEPGVTVHNLYAMYTIGWFYNINREPEIPNTIPLQKTATNILGLEFAEIIPKISSPNGSIIYDKQGAPITEKYITIAPHSTSGLKYWTSDGWQEVINFLKLQGFRVINVSKEGCDFDGVELLGDYSMNNTMKIIKGSEFFIGLSSGLSWLAWALNKQVVMISNFTEETHEFTANCLRITDTSVCNSCWNNPKHKFDKGDWNWCPEQKNTERQFECHKSITGKRVINEIKKLL